MPDINKSIVYCNKDIRDNTLKLLDKRRELNFQIVRYIENALRADNVNNVNDARILIDLLEEASPEFSFFEHPKVYVNRWQDCKESLSDLLNQYKKLRNS